MLGIAHKCASYCVHLCRCNLRATSETRQTGGKQTGMNLFSKIDKITKERKSASEALAANLLHSAQRFQHMPIHCQNEM